ncbi:MAG: hypothetical protein K0R02_55 [Rickettsiaceae bacterium]|jgi:hypothetical protein|nr:hypothetical protein [Rickettsiaceae bacterium]
MLKLKNFFSLLFITISFSGCMSAKIPDKQVKDVLNNNKALIIFSASAKETESDINYPVSTIWKNTLTKEYIPSSNDSFYDSAWDYVLKAHVVNPGTYRLKKIIFTTFSYDKQTTHTIYIDHPIEFSTKGGEAIYLGHIDFRSTPKGISYKVEDKFDKINKDHEKFLHKFQNRLLNKTLKIK